MHKTWDADTGDVRLTLPLPYHRALDVGCGCDSEVRLCSIVGYGVYPTLLLCRTNIDSLCISYYHLMDHEIMKFRRHSKLLEGTMTAPTGSAADGWDASQLDIPGMTPRSSKHSGRHPFMLFNAQLIVASPPTSPVWVPLASIIKL